MKINILFYIKSITKYFKFYCIAIVLTLVVLSTSECIDNIEAKQFLKIKAYPYNLDEKTYPKIILQNVIQVVTTDSSLFAEITKFETYGKQFYIFDEKVTKSLYIFNDNGEFIYNIKRGNGPGELNFPSDFILDTISKEICIIDNPGYRYYDLQGNFLRDEVTAPFHFLMTVEMLKNNELISFNGNPAPSDIIEGQKNKSPQDDLKKRMYSVMILNKKVDLEIGKFFPISYNESQLSRKKPISNFNGKIYCLEGGWSTKIYNLKENKQFVPAYEVDFTDKNVTKNDKKMPWSQVMRLIKKGERMGMIDYLFITDKFLSFSYLSDDENSPCIYSFERNQTYSLTKILEFNGLPKVQPLKFINNDVLLCAIYIDDYLDFRELNINLKHPKLNLTVNHRDNPILIEIKIQYK